MLAPTNVPRGTFSSTLEDLERDCRRLRLFTIVVPRRKKLYLDAENTEKEVQTATKPTS